MDHPSLKANVCYSIGMKVLHVIARVNRGGTSTWLAELVPGLREIGIENVIATGRVSEGEIEDPIFNSLNCYRIEGLGRSISIIQDFKAFRSLRKLTLTYKPDVINTHTSKAGVIGRMVAVSLGRNRPAVVHTYHGHLLYGYFGKLSTLLFILIEKALGIFTDGFISSGEKVKNELLKAGIGEENKFCVIRPGVKRLPVLKKEDLREKFKIPTNSILIGWLGRLAPIKRPDRVVSLAQELPNFVFFVGGEGVLLSELIQVAPKNVIFAGWVNPEEIWNIADIALLTSDNEAQPISLVEAALSGIPQVGWNVGSVSEVIIEAETGFLVTSEQDAIKHITKLAQDYELRQKLGAKAKEYAMETFNPQQFIELHLRSYERAILVLNGA